MAKISFKAKLFSKAGKRNLIIFCAVLLIGVAVYLNYQWFYLAEGDLGYGDNNMTGGDTGEGTVNVSTYFSATQLSRREARDEALEVLQSVVEGEDSSDTARAEAMAEISRIAKDIEDEATIESLVKAKGFENCVAVISGDKVNVVVSSQEELVSAEVARINEIVYETTGILPTNVKIIKK